MTKWKLTWKDRIELCRLHHDQKPNEESSECLTMLSVSVIRIFLAMISWKMFVFHLNLPKMITLEIKFIFGSLATSPDKCHQTKSTIDTVKSSSKLIWIKLMTSKTYNVGNMIIFKLWIFHSTSKTSTEYWRMWVKVDISVYATINKQNIFHA